MLNPITYTEGVVGDFLRYQLSTYAFADSSLYAQMRRLLNLEQSRSTPLLQGPYISLSRTFRKGDSIAKLVDEGVLHPHIRQISPYPSAYLHQEQAFRAIAAGRTTLVATGTGSGKTECFLLPIISRCLQLRDEGAPAGITAVIVYPMNALAEDQLQRMRELLVGTGISFGMYVGKTPRHEADVNGVRLAPGSTPADYRQRHAQMQQRRQDVALHPAEERVSREAMREPGQQPHILLTNVKQLELLLTRQQDLDLFDNALLEYLVFDEAHTFSGAGGAETACLIRRLRAYCGKDERGTTCIATSATIADPESGEQAGRDFASRFFGVDGTQVALIGESYEEDIWGEPRTVSAPFNGDQAVQLHSVLDLLDALDQPEPDAAALQRFQVWFQTTTGTRAGTAGTDNWRHQLNDWLSHNEVVYQIAQALRRPRPVASLLEELTETLGRPVTEEEVLIWLALGAAARAGERPLLRPVVHGFVRGVSGAVVTFEDKQDLEARLWLSAEDAASSDEGRDPELKTFPLLSCTTCGQHYFEHSLEDFNFTGEAIGGGQANGKQRSWQALDVAQGSIRALSLDHQVGADDEDEPAHTEVLHVCRYCGTAHDEPVALCAGCGRDKATKPLYFVGQHEERPGLLSRCVSCGANGRRYLGSYREPARPVRATAVADVHVLAQSMIHHAERRRLLVFADNRQDAAFQAGWMQDRSRRYRLRELLYQKLREGPISVGDLTLWLDRYLDEDDELSRALIPEVWRAEPKSKTGQAHAEERKWFLRVQILRELTMGARQSTGLEPLGRLKVRYYGLDTDLPAIDKWAQRLDCSAEDLTSGIASLLDAARSRRQVYDPVTRIYSKFWMDGEKEILRGYLPSMKGVPEGLVLERDGQHHKGRIKQWYSNYDTTAKQVAIRWGVPKEDVPEFLHDVWKLCHDELQLLVGVQLKGARGNNLPGTTGANQVDIDKLLLEPGHGMYRCQTCRRLHARPNPTLTCMAFRCDGRLVHEEENPDSYDLLQLDQGFSMLRAREHSAQVPTSERERIETIFKGDSERINTLVCTPTLELGVNIGALDAVLMRNVPPLPANYWQRAGRAGRQFRMALNLTYARTTSHDRAYFAEPLKLLEGQVEPPSFNLRNEVMVAKHVHATIITTLFQLLRNERLPADEANALETALHQCLPPRITPYLFTSTGHVRPRPLGTTALQEQIDRHRNAVVQAVNAAFEQGWPQADKAVVADDVLAGIIDGFGAALQEVIDRLYKRLKWALGQLDRLRKVASSKGTLEADEEALRYRCERLVKKLKGATQRRRSQAEGVDETYTYGVLAAEGFLPGYGLDTGAVSVTHIAPRHATDIWDSEIRRGTALAVREYVPGNLIYANGHKFVARHFQLEARDSMMFAVDVEHESVQETGTSSTQTDGVSSMATTVMPGVAMCDVEAPHQSYISDEEDFRFQMPVAIFAQDQGRHAGGQVYEWGGENLQLRHGMHVRLVNVGAARMVREGRMGYPLCTVCGASRSPMSTARELQHFDEFHSERCGQPIQNVGFFAETVADALVLQDCASQEVGYSLMESLRQGATDVLDMELSDLQVQIIGKPGTEAVDALLYDPMPGGSGLLEQMLRSWPAVVAAAAHIVQDCPANCEASCIDCLQRFRNSFYHDKLSRHTALEHLQRLGARLQNAHVLPPVLPDGTLTKQPGNQPEQELVALLDAAGLTNFETERPIPLHGGVTTRPDVYYHEPNPQYEGVCVYLDGMSSHLHGNPQTAARDREIRDELRNTGYEVVEIPSQDLFDRTAMRQHMRRIARAVVGKQKAKDLASNDSWFDHSRTVKAGTAAATLPETGSDNVLPFRTTAPGSDDFSPYENCVPFSSLRAAAGSWSEEQTGLEGLAKQAEEWAILEDHKLERGMFVAQVVGHSMEPLVPSGSYCLFRPVPGGTRQGRKLLVWHAGTTDAETGGQYTLKVYSSEKSVSEDGGWAHTRITLKPLNPNYEPVILEPESESEVAAVAEFVSVLS